MSPWVEWSTKEDSLKVAEAEAARSELEETAAAAKRKATKASDELADLRLHLSTLTARNADLERKQRKYALSQTPSQTLNRVGT